MRVRMGPGFGQGRNEERQILAVGAGIHSTPASEMKVDAHEYFARLGDYFIAKFGDRLATAKAQMVFDACGPGRDLILRSCSRMTATAIPGKKPY